MTISLKEAREIREQLRPAFAGYVTDGDISERDVLATLMDLIVRGVIGIQAKTQKKPVEVEKVYFTGVPDSLLEFEKQFIYALFKDSYELTSWDVRLKIRSGDLHKAISEHLKELSYNEIIGQRLLFFDDQGRRIDVNYYDVDTKREYEVKTVSDLREFQRRSEDKLVIYLLATMFWVAPMVVFVAVSPTTDGSSSLPVIISLIAFAAISIGITYYEYRKLRKTKNLLLLEFENNLVPFTKKKYEELFDFIKAHPMKSQRLDNEFMPHAIAFGLDDSWNRSFELSGEAVVRSGSVV